MTDEDKKKRKERIQRVAEAKDRKPVKECVYWMTRDLSADGIVSESVDVWLVKPERVRLTGGTGAYWRTPGGAEIFVQTNVGPKPARVGTRTLESCLLICRVYPDDSLMCIKVGNEEPNIASKEDAGTS